MEGFYITRLWAVTTFSLGFVLQTGVLVEKAVFSVFSVFKCLLWGCGLCAAVTGICGINAWVLVGAGEGSVTAWKVRILS